MKLSETEKPVFIVSKEKAENNILKMKKKCSDNDLSFRPHFKTHQSIETGKIFKKHGINKIAVSNMDMAYKFIKEGFTDICLAITFNPNLVNKINAIHEKFRFSIIIESAYSAELINRGIKRNTDVLIKIDAGACRTGIKINNEEAIYTLINKINNSEKLKFKGFLIHNGQTYQKDKEEVKNIHIDSLEKFAKLKSTFSRYNPEISYGDTPTASICNRFDNIDELRPGNFVYYDLMQFYYGICDIGDIAGFVNAPVLAVNKAENKLIAHAGAVYLSKESININNENIFGELIITDNKLNYHNYSSPVRINYLSQEHAIIKTDNKTIEMFNPGDTVQIIPVHSCLTANLMKENTFFI